MYDWYVFLIRRSKMDGYLHNVFSKLLRLRFPYLIHHPPLHVHPGSSHIYDTMRRVSYLLFMANQVYSTRLPTMRAYPCLLFEAQQLPQPILRIIPD